MSQKCGAEVLYSVLEHKKAVMCLTERMHMLDYLSSGMGYSGIGCEFNVNESTMHVK